MQENIRKPDELLPKLRLKGRDSAEILTVLKVDWPVAGLVLEKLVALIGVASHAGRDTHSSLQEIVEHALQAYSEALHRENSAKMPDPIRISVFLNVVLTETCRYLQVELADRAGHMWSADQGKTLAQWGKESKAPLERMECDTQSIALRRALYDLLASDELKSVLRKSNHEKAVLAGDLALCH